MSRIPVTIITGFLGAGKTTLIRHILQNASSKRLAILVNEFGEIGVDGALLRECSNDNCPEESMIELANGCICCTVADDFIPAIDKLLALSPRPDHIIIETSGLALPQPLVQAFQWPDLKSRIMLDAVITIVDGPALIAGKFAQDPIKVQSMREADPALDHDQPIVELFEDQLSAGNIVLLGKADMLNAEETEKAIEEIKKLAPHDPKIVKLFAGAVPTNLILGLNLEDLAIERANADYHHKDEADHDHDEFSTYMVKMPEFSSDISFTETLKTLVKAHDIIRVKAWLKVTNKPMPLIVQGVGNQIESYYGTRPNSSGDNVIIFIAEGERNITEIATALGGEVI